MIGDRLLIDKSIYDRGFYEEETWWVNRMTDILYENKDGFKILKHLGDVEYFADILESAIMKYGLTDPPDYEELGKIVNVANEYLSDSAFFNALGYQVYVNDKYLSAIKKISQSLLAMDNQNLKSEESYKDFFESITNDLKQAKKNWIGLSMCY